MKRAHGALFFALKLNYNRPMPVFKTLNKGKVPVKIYTDNIESQALEQLINLSQLDIIHGHIAAMPDVHAGIGATVGSVIPTKSAIIPAAVGVDIGCGMNAVRLSLRAKDLPDNLKLVRQAIEKAIPVGFDMHNITQARDSTVRALIGGLEQITARHPQIVKMIKRFDLTWQNQLATLGGGNHFIELCLDENDDVWVMLHSGSRGIGNAIGRYFIEQAKKDMQRHIQQLPDKNLAYFSEGSVLFDDYVHAVHWAQDYAMENRREMMRLILDTLKKHLPSFTLTKEAINCHHNYVAIEEHFGESLYVTRKGAIRAGKDDFGIIPGSMGARSYIVRGKGSKASLLSCSHGAGRAMSRTQARKQFNREDLIAQTHGVECRKDKAVIDEIPSAYKCIDHVMRQQDDLVEVLHTLKQVLCVKG